MSAGGGLPPASAAPSACVLSPDQIAEALASTVSLLTSLTASQSRGVGSAYATSKADRAEVPIEDNIHSRFLATLVKTLNGIIVEVRG